MDNECIACGNDFSFIRKADTIHYQFSIFNFQFSSAAA